jgi:uncharacterized protein (UPF0548 family)
MLSLRKPSAESVNRFLAAEAKRAFSYTDVGTTASTPPAGFVLDHTRIKLGEGQSVFLAGKAALRRWDQMRLGWVDVGPSTPQIVMGENLAVMGWAIGLWWLNSCRIIYVIDESEPISRFGFAYGTLPGHVESGEERFLIEWDQSNDTVWYDILAFSRPNHFLARLGYPVVRRTQKRFGRDSAAAMLKAVRAGQHLNHKI